MITLKDVREDILSENVNPIIKKFPGLHRHAIVFGRKSREVNKLINSGYRSRKKNPDKAIKNFEEAKKLLNELLKEANEIKDDNMIAACAWELANVPTSPGELAVDVVAHEKLNKVSVLELEREGGKVGHTRAEVKKYLNQRMARVNKYISETKKR